MSDSVIEPSPDPVVAARLRALHALLSGGKGEGRIPRGVAFMGWTLPDGAIRVTAFAAGECVGIYPRPDGALPGG